MTKGYNAGAGSHRFANGFYLNLSTNRLNKMDRNSTVHPGNGCNGKLKIAGDNFSSLLKSISNYVHSRGGVGCERYLFRFGINEFSDPLSDNLPLCEPLIPMDVPISHHLLVILCCCRNHIQR